MNSAARRRRHAAFRYGRLVKWLVSGALLIAFTSYVALPFGIVWYLPQYAAQYGVRLDVERARVEPFSSRLDLFGVRVAASGGSSIEWSSIETRVDLAELLSGRLVLDDFRLSEAKLHTGDPGVNVTGVLSKVPAALPEEVSIGELFIDGIELATVSEALGHPATIDWLRISSLDGVYPARGRRGRGRPLHRGGTLQPSGTRQPRRIGLDSQCCRDRRARRSARWTPESARSRWVLARKARRRRDRCGSSTHRSTARSAPQPAGGGQSKDWSSGLRMSRFSEHGPTGTAPHS